MKKSGLSILLIILIVSSSSFAQDSLKNITLKDIWSNYSFSARSVRGMKSLNNGKEYTRIKKGSIVVYDYLTGDSVTTLVNGKNLIAEGDETPIKIGSFSMNNDENMFLFPTNSESIYRHSSKSDYFIWSSNSNTLTPL